MDTDVQPSKYVHVTGYGLRPFKIKEEYQMSEDSPKQYKGQYKLPDGITTTEGNEWVDLDYYFTEGEII